MVGGSSILYARQLTILLSRYEPRRLQSTVLGLNQIVDSTGHAPSTDQPPLPLHYAPSTSLAPPTLTAQRGYLPIALMVSSLSPCRFSHRFRG